MGHDETEHQSLSYTVISYPVISVDCLQQLMNPIALKEMGTVYAQQKKNRH